MLTAGIAVDKATLNFDKAFSYIVPQSFKSIIEVGSIALVPFGKGGRLRVGVVLSLEEKQDVKNLKTIIDVKTQGAVVDPFTLKLIEHIKETTFCTYYEAVRTVMPYSTMYKISNDKLESKTKISCEKIYTAKKCENSVKLNANQQKVYDYLLNSHKSIKQICDNCLVTKSVVETLVKKGVIYWELKEKECTEIENITPKNQEIILSQEQQRVYQDILSKKDNKPHLLHGVTASGKSIVFLKLINDALEKGEGAMLLVPEISLTPQMIHLLKETFGEIVSVIHSRLTQQERLRQYNRLQMGQAKVVVGTRSAVFAQALNLKLIIIDEEHEKSFKSESSPRYSAIRVASFIAKEKNARLLLASATPSIESYYLAQNGFYHLHKLEKRFNDMPMPEVEIIDMRMQALMGDVGVVSNAVIKYIADNILNNKQSIILINRRGYSTVGVCKNCKQTLQCDDCSVNLVKHKLENKLNCHYCGKSYEVAEKCPECGGQLQYIGYGTQKVEEYIQTLIPTARILRMDSDTTGKSNSHTEMLADFSDKKYNILIGTQMVAKGLDFKDVSLVCVLGIDGALNQVSYNGNEQAFNLLTQVIGRAGRKQDNSRAVVQTYDSENNIIKLAQRGDYESFYNGEIAFRKLNIYPPFCTMCTVAFTSEKETRAAKDAAAFLQLVKQNTQALGDAPLVALGPVPFNVAMVSKNYRYRITLKCKNTKKFRDFLRMVTDKYLENAENTSAIYINVNPLQE